MPLPTHIAREIARLMRDPDALRHERMPASGQRGRYNPSQPRVPAGHSDGGQWTDDGHNGPTARPIQQVRGDLLRRPAQRALEALLTVFAAVSALNRPGQQAIVEFRARGFEPDAASRGVLDEGNVAILNRSEVEQACPRFGEVQSLTDRATNEVRSGGGIMSATQFGTKVHARLKYLVESRHDPNFVAEVSYSGADKNAVYGAKNTIRVDVLERLGNGVVCVYDIKTGARGLEGPRMTTIARKVLKRFPDTRRIIVTEVRPSR
jgi:hypothetical protein